MERRLWRVTITSLIERLCKDKLSKDADGTHVLQYGGFTSKVRSKDSRFTRPIDNDTLFRGV